MLYLALQGETVKMVIVYNFISDEDSKFIFNEEQLYFEIICIITFSAISKCDFSCAHYVYVLEAFIMWEKHLNACMRVTGICKPFSISVGSNPLWCIILYIRISYDTRFVFVFLHNDTKYIFSVSSLLQNIYFRFSLGYKILRTQMIIVMIM